MVLQGTLFKQSTWGRTWGSSVKTRHHGFSRYLDQTECLGTWVHWIVRNAKLSELLSHLHWSCDMSDCCDIGALGWVKRLDVDLWWWMDCHGIIIKVNFVFFHLLSPFSVHPHTIYIWFQEMIGYLQWQYRSLCETDKKSFEVKQIKLVWINLSLRQLIWGNMWKLVQEKNLTNAANVTMHPFRQGIWRNIWKYTVERSQTNAISVTLHPLRQPT